MVSASKNKPVASHAQQGQAHTPVLAPSPSHEEQISTLQMEVQDLQKTVVELEYELHNLKLKVG